MESKITVGRLFMLEAVASVAALASELGEEPELGFGGVTDLEDALSFKRCAAALEALLAPENAEALGYLLDMLVDAER